MPADLDRPHRYFVSYTYRLRGQTEGCCRHGSYAINLALPIMGANDVLFVSSRIEKDNPTYEGVVVGGWQKFEDLT